MDQLYRIMDANLNRAREGLRVAEELVRLVLEDVGLQKQIKSLRHGVTAAENLLPRTRLLKSRAAYRDPGAKTSVPEERKRSNLQCLVRANFRRAQEALRVLEEISKVKSGNAGRRFKTLRFKTYDLEGAVVEQIEKWMYKQEV